MFIFIIVNYIIVNYFFFFFFFLFFKYMTLQKIYINLFKEKYIII